MESSSKESAELIDSVPISIDSAVPQLTETRQPRKKKVALVANKLPSIKILVLHGFQQYYARIEEKIAPWLKFLSRTYTLREVLIPEAPNKTLASDPNDPFKCWLALNHEDPLDFDGRWSLTEAHYHFFEESENHLLGILKDHPDVDIMINFSQGSLFGSLFLAKHRSNRSIFSNLKLVINVCGVGLPRVINENLVEMVDKLYDEKEQIETPTLFLVGLKDQVVPLPRTLALAKWYKNKQFIEFDGPHCIPKQKIYMEQVKTFIDNTLQAEDATKQPTEIN